jgi:hypothetical protein
MPYLNCGRCGLQIKVQPAFLRMENCPRCLARSATKMPMVLRPNGVVQAAGWGLRPADGDEASDRGGPSHAPAT